MLIFTMLMSHVGKHYYSGKRKAFSAKLYGTIMLAIPFSLLSGQVIAQIIPDNTLPNNSIVAPNGNSFTIDGGTPAGSNLFHSFREFSLPTGSEAFFNNSSNIQNIFSRVTGEKISNIDGLIRANGRANLFFINPNGIIFGPNARLNIGGSFIGSTANSIQFSDGNFFSAADPQAPPLLTVNVPIGLQFGQNPGTIQVQGEGHGFTLKDTFSSPVDRSKARDGLEVKSDSTIALVGGNVNLEGGLLKTEGGRIELGSVSEGRVSLSPTAFGWTFGYEQVQGFGDINLSRQAGVDASGSRAGSISIVGRQVRLTDGSVALIQNLGEQSGGNLSINASESVQLRGTDTNGIISSRLANLTLGGGNGGDIKVSTQRLTIEDGAIIVARTFDAGNGGNIIVKASDSGQFKGFSPINTAFFSAVESVTFGSGKGGNISISTQRLTLLNGGGVGTTSFGSGAGGNLTLDATDSVELIGVQPGLLQPSQLSAVTSGGNAGNLTINTSRLIVRNGGSVDSSTFVSGSAGNIVINARDSVEVSGRVEGSINPSRIQSGASILDAVIRERFGLPDRPSGNSGNVTINTPRLTVSDGARVSVANQGTGTAGNLQINARDIFLNNQGSLTASTASGTGGNIELQVSGDTILRNNSQISAEAAGTGNGGNLTANTSTLTILEGSKVTANAFQGNGGNIRIATSGLFTSPDSRITASSSFGVSGTISINNPNLEPSSGLVQLPQNVVDPTTQIAQGCGANQTNTFTIAGRGGLPEEPTATLRGQTVWQDLQNYATESPQSQNEPSKTSPVTTIPDNSSLVEAVGWQINAKGEVELVANLPDGAEVAASDRAIPNCRRQQTDRN